MDEDLNSIASYIKTCHTHIHHAFRLPSNKIDFSNEVIFGLKHKTGGAPIEYSKIKTTNVNAGKSKSSEKTAGASPSAFIVDEFGKFDARAMYEAAKPSFGTIHGWKAVPLCVGTGGNTELSQGARIMCYNPEMFNFMECDWDWLERRITDPDLITWERKKFVCFVPAQMAYEVGVVKIKTNLAEYFGIKSKKLSKITVLRQIGD